MLNFKLPLDFVSEKASLNWSEVEFGLQGGWLDADAAVGLAMDRMAREVSPPPEVLELASVLPHERRKVPYLVERLAKLYGPLSKEKWLYLLLAWIYENRDRFDDAFRVVEEVYATFDYPDEIASFVRYMPAEDPSRAGENYMLKAWSQYLARQHAVFGRRAENAQ